MAGDTVVYPRGAALGKIGISWIESDMLFTVPFFMINAGIVVGTVP
jgi:hypothetical protein